MANQSCNDNVVYIFQQPYVVETMLQQYFHNNANVGLQRFSDFQATKHHDAFSTFPTMFTKHLLNINLFAGQDSILHNNILVQDREFTEIGCSSVEPLRNGY